MGCQKALERGQLILLFLYPSQQGLRLLHGLLRRHGFQWHGCKVLHSRSAHICMQGHVQIGHRARQDEGVSLGARASRCRAAMVCTGTQSNTSGSSQMLDTSAGHHCQTSQHDATHEHVMEVTPAETLKLDDSIPFGFVRYHLQTLWGRYYLQKLSDQGCRLASLVCLPLALCAPSLCPATSEKQACSVPPLRCAQDPELLFGLTLGLSYAKLCAPQLLG